ncbi:sulfur carrier protein ThiS [Acetivibrio saccincola]|jgi:sulfur carrier protein|uniref:sulfur carrier protein ThiS n=1 Tax=Acetivibrio saccincola TaxID=1677857 RepID=UPI001697D60C|nr:sulfur carrier protein ThiS [Acetivibrio saccincola]NLM59301.1 sulfur carrier protein ThiS [Clostridium sp.]NLW26315.1 sulfur carrier protein ThiS [Acetivibrio saccincola]HOA79477.1 sulfur carrier protein ThiS [Defluviitaleaceae bacterium]
MKIMLNGKEKNIDNNLNLLSLIVSEGINPKSVIVEYNSEQPPRDEWDSIVLKENDNIEVLKFIVGG